MKITTLTILLATSTTIVEGSSSIRGGRITNNDQSITAAADNKSMVEILQSLNEERAPNKFKESTIQYYIATQSQPQSQQSKQQRNLQSSLEYDNNGAGYEAPNGCWYPTAEDYNNEEELHYPVYSAGWSNGYCSLRKSCTSGEGHSDSKSCCDNSYPGQPGDNCYDVAGLERETEEPLGEMWYPDRVAPYMKATCLSTLDATDEVLTTELYDDHQECCEESYTQQGPTDPCLQGVSGYVAPAAGTEDERWYPDYEVGYVDGTCLSNVDVPNPHRTEAELFDTQLECCQEKYKDQASGACLNALPEGLRPTQSPTGVDGGVAPFFFPDWSAKWEDQTCTNALEDGKVPSHVTEYYTFETELECCLEVYDTQESQACLDSLPAGQKPTTAPSTADMKGRTPFYYPDQSENDFADQTCTNLLNDDGEVPLYVIVGQNTYETAEECCEAHYSTQVSGACMEAVYDSLPAGQRPTSSPTGEDGPLNNWYHNYDDDYANAICDHTRIGFSSGVSPSDPEDRWSTRLECCENELGSQYNNKCYCWATACDPENADDPCTTAAPFTFDATVGADSCVGEDACRGATGTIGECCSGPSCRDIGSCIGESACRFFGYDATDNANPVEVAGSKIGKSSCIGQDSCTNSYGTIGDESCSTTATSPSCAANTGNIGDRSCTAGQSCLTNQGDIGNDSCNGETACSGNAGEIDDGSCKGKNACTNFGLDGLGAVVPDSSIGKSSCLEESSCVLSSGTIGDGSCTKGGDGASDDPSCPDNTGTIKDGSCTGLGSCQVNSGDIGDGSCGGKLACASNTGSIGDDSCTAEKSCSSDSSLNSRTIGSASCKKTGACSNLQVDVGDNSCNRSEGCNDCTEEVLNNQCNGGSTDCPASCN